MDFSFADWSIQFIKLIFFISVILTSSNETTVTILIKLLLGKLCFLLVTLENLYVLFVSEYEFFPK